MIANGEIMVPQGCSMNTYWMHKAWMIEYVGKRERKQEEIKGRKKEGMEVGRCLKTLKIFHLNKESSIESYWDLCCAQCLVLWWKRNERETEDEDSKGS